MIWLLLFFTLWFALLHADVTKEGLTYLNTFRTDAGLIALRENKTLSKAAKSHAKYLIQNQSHGHYEKKESMLLQVEHLQIVL